MDAARPEIQLISNLVVANEEGQILFIKHDPEEDRWWLPGDDLTPYQHPDERAREILGSIQGLAWQEPRMVSVQSFRGRRGWHVMFNYYVTGSGSVDAAGDAAWFSLDDLPRTKHGTWEHDTVREVLGKAVIRDA